jgi:hypothetical protein
VRLETHSPSSPFQAGSPAVQLLLPDHGVTAATRFLYVLPVEAGDRSECGDGLAEVAKLNVHNEHNLVCVRPTFAQAPWYADHPVDPEIRQESHLLQVVLPVVDQAYGVEDPDRLLLGFSKSGWGAWSLLLRHPHLFHRAAAFDAPLAWESPNRYGMAQVFGTQENMNRYCIVDLLGTAKDLVGGEPRLGLLGYSDFRGQHQFLHYHMLKLNVPHAYQDGPRREHRWDSGWLPQAVEFLANGQLP